MVITKGEKSHIYSVSCGTLIAIISVLFDKKYYIFSFRIFCDIQVFRATGHTISLVISDVKLSIISVAVDLANW